MTNQNIEAIANAANTSFVFVCAVLVFLMQLGFAMLESGLNSNKHTANILFKNLADVCIASLVFGLIGFGIMYPESYSATDTAIRATSGWVIVGFGIPNGEGVNWFYQLAFAATAATIVSGAVAGRMKFRSYLLFSALLAGFVYPLVGRLCWSEYGKTWQKEHLDFVFNDFAGSMVVHGVGGATALAAVLVLRARYGRFPGSSMPRPPMHHNLAYALMGTLLLWTGWYGFNGGSISRILKLDSETNQLISEYQILSKVVVNTTIGAASGALSAMFIWTISNKKKLNLLAAINGCLGGLVAITANCDLHTPITSAVIGSSAGLIVVFGESLLEAFKKDDTVCAIPVHLFCGIWGATLATPSLSIHRIVPQAFFTLTILFLVFIFMYFFFRILHKKGFLEIEIEDEREGLDQFEHELDAYIFHSN